MYYLTSLLLFDIPLLYCHINLASSIIFYLSSVDIYLSLDISLSNPIYFLLFVTVSELFCGEIFETFVILSAILLPIKSPIASAIFRIAVFEAVLSASVANYLAWSRSFWLCLLLKFLLIFLSTFFLIFLAKDKNP